MVKFVNTPMEVTGTVTDAKASHTTPNGEKRGICTWRAFMFGSPASRNIFSFGHGAVERVIVRYLTGFHVLMHW